MLALLAACGGGGGGGGTPPIDTTPQVQGPPTVAASLANTTDEAAQSAKAAVAAADAAATNSNSLTGVFALFGAPTGFRATPNASLAKPLAAQTAGCADVVDTPCTGSAMLDTNLASNATTAPAGTYIDVTFVSLNGYLFGDSVSLNGRLRIDFLAAMNLSAPGLEGLDLQLLLDNLSGSFNGFAFGPVSQAARLQVDAQGHSIVTAGGRRYMDVAGVTVVDASNYTIGGSAVRSAHWTQTQAYVDLALEQWQVVNGRPAVGSHATLTAGTGSIALQVTSSSTATMVYTATITLGNASAIYTVTATYPTSGAPTYVATPAG